MRPFFQRGVGGAAGPSDDDTGTATCGQHMHTQTDRGATHFISGLYGMYSKVQSFKDGLAGPLACHRGTQCVKFPSGVQS